MFQCYLCVALLAYVVNVIFFIVECGIAHFARCAYSMFGHHPHPQATLGPDFISFEASIAKLAHGEN